MEQARATIGVLGPIVAAVPGQQPSRISNRRQARILAALVTSHARETSVDELIDKVFDGDRPDNPEPSLRTYVNRLRKGIGDTDATMLVTTPGGYRLDDVDVDADEFEQQVAGASVELEPYGALTLLDQALELWAGPPFSGLEDAQWLVGEVARLTELRLGAVEHRLRLFNEMGRYADTVHETATLVEQHPWREHVRRLRTVALYRTGRQAEALDELTAHRVRMRDELGLDPDDALVDLERRILAHDPTLDVPDAGGRRLRGYRLGALAGIGAHSRVYRAHQPTIDREVAVKIIRRDLANVPAFVRRFQAEARLVARLVHPHIVPVFDYWREPDRACLVMPWLEGGTLQARLEDLDVPPGGRQGARANGSAGARADHAALDPTTGEAILAQVGSALAHAHAAGITHSDVTARNVLFDRDGNAYLSDFGIAVEVGEVDADVDVAAFDRLAQQVVPGVDSRRFLAPPTVGEPGGRPNPYRGLDAFDTADATRFHGRDATIERLMTSIDTSPLTLLVGPSGSGKSSVIGAGVQPALHADQRLVTRMVPGTRPMARLVEAISSLSTDPDVDRDRIEEEGLSRVCADAIGATPTVVVIDQFEEVFTTSDRAECEVFLQTLARIPSDSHVRVLLGVRADFYGAALATRYLATAATEATVALPPMTPAELTTAMTAPATSLGITVDHDLVARLLSDSVDRPGGLPLLQFVLTEMWEHRTDPVRLTLEDHHAVGGIDGVVSSVADAHLAVLDAAGRDGTRRLFARLVHVGDEVTSQRTLLADLLELPDVDRSLVDGWVQARMLTTDRDPVTRDPTIELAHESLVDAWPTLGAWTEESRQHLEVLQRLRRDAEEWDESAHDPALLWRGSRLAAATPLQDDHAIGLTERESAFLAASTDRAAEEREAGARAERHASSRRRALAVAAVVAVVAVAALGWAVRTQRQASARQAAVDQATLVSNAASLVGTRDDLALLLAAEAYARDDGVESQRLLVEALAQFDADDEVWTEPEFTIATADGDCVDIPTPGRVVVQPNRSRDDPDAVGAIVDIDLVDREVSVIEDVPVACDVHAAPATATGGPSYAGTTADGELVTVEVDGTIHGPFPGLSRPFWGPDGTLYARNGGGDEAGDFRAVDPVTGTASGDPVITAIDVRTGPDGTGMWVVFQDDVRGRLGTTLALLDPTTFEERGDRRTGVHPYSPPAFSADGSTMAYSEEFGALVVYDVESGQHRELELNPADQVALSPSGVLVATSVVDAGEIEVRQVADGRLIETITPIVRPMALEWLAEDRLGILRSSGVVDLVELGSSLYERGPACCPTDTLFAMFSSDGIPEPFSYTAKRDGTGHFRGHPSGATSTVDMSPFVFDPFAAELRLPDGAAMLIKPPAEVQWVDRAGILLETMEPFGPDYSIPLDLPFYEVAHEQDAREAIMFGMVDGTPGAIESLQVAWIDTMQRQLIDGPFDVTFDPPVAFADVHPGPVLVTEEPAGGDDVVVTFRELDGDTLEEVVLPGPVGWVRLGPDRRHVIAANDANDSIRWIDLETGESRVLPINAGPDRPDLLDDGRFLVHTREGQYELWDITAPDRIAVLADPGPSAILGPSVSLDQSHVWIILDGYWSKIPLDPEVWVEQACALAGRTLSDEERADLVPGSAREPACQP
ncbi:MAG TPA: BTAD domain-containing putative transcriptional regulator [Nitriliruptoraceae bacterium]|nr:BTAD domain-containing putative transcriptional regulator [Nitriliruptoraceae bacterium]